MNSNQITEITKELTCEFLDFLKFKNHEIIKPENFEKIYDGSTFSFNTMLEMFIIMKIGLII